ncbi:hypothetical protein [Microbacterium sp. YY-01]|uniref:hypothetical protein n=1 Tax=Microbacterium sp. YY-01 TaxID=3421634 RepID=UPI003D18019C
MTENLPTSITVNRRTMLKSAAWSVPVIAVAATAPLASASDPTTPAPRFDVQIRQVTWSAGAFTGDIRFEALTAVPAGTVLTVVISPVTTGGRMFQVQRNSDSNYIHVPTNGTGSTNGTTKTLSVTGDISTGEKAFVNMNFTGYVAAVRPVTVTVSDGTTVLATRTWQ